MSLRASLHDHAREKAPQVKGSPVGSFAYLIEDDQQNPQGTSSQTTIGDGPRCDLQLLIR